MYTRTVASSNDWQFKNFLLQHCRLFLEDAPATKQHFDVGAEIDMKKTLLISGEASGPRSETRKKKKKECSRGR